MTVGVEVVVHAFENCSIFYIRNTFSILYFSALSFFIVLHLQ